MRRVMMNYKMRLIFSVLIIILFLTISETNAKIKRDSNLIKEAYDKTGIKLDLLYDKDEIIKCDIKVSRFAPGTLCLPEEQFGSAEIKKEVKNTPAIKAQIFFSSGLCCGIILARFKSEKNAMLGYYDISGDKSDLYLKKSLLSGETIENATILTYNKAGLDVKIQSFLIYKNCVLDIIMAREHGNKLSKEDFIFIDNFIKLWKKIIDLSF